MDSILPLIWQQFGSPWLALALGAGWLLHATGLVGHLVGARVTEATRLSTDRQVFMTTMLAELTEIRKRHALDIVEYDKRLAAEVARADEAQLDAKRWRHLIGSMGVHLMRQRRLLERHNIEPPRFDWSHFIAEGGDPGEFAGMW